MKRIRKFLKETKTGGMLGAKRRQQMRLLMVCFGIFALAMVVAIAGSYEAGSMAPLAAMALVPVIGGADMTQFAKKNEELTPEEKATLGTVQKAMLDTLQETLKGTITEEQMKERLDSIVADINKSQAESSKALQSKYDDALKIIQDMRKDLNGVQDDIKSATEKYASKEGNTIEESMKNVFESERFKGFANNTVKSTGIFDLNLKSLRKKGVVNVTEDYSGTTIPALRTDIITTEVPLERRHIRDFMRVIDASEEEITTVYFRQIYDIDRAALAVSENGRLPEGSFKVKEAMAETNRIGWHMFVSRRMLRKISFIQNRILTLMPSGLYRQEDFQLLYGDDNDANFKGITTVALTESALSGAVYTESAAGKVKSIASYADGAATLVTLNGPYAKIQTGMKVVFSGFQTATDMNAAGGFEITVLNDNMFTVPCAYTAETDASVLANVTFVISGGFASLVPDANMGDAMRAVNGYLEFDTYRPSLIIVNPMTLYSFLAIKDKVGRPLWREYFQIVNGIYYLDGITPIVTCDAMKKGYMLIGDFINAAELYDTQRGFVEFAEDVDTKLTNEVCCIIQEEVIFAVTCPDAFMYVNINNLVETINVEGGSVKVAITSPLNEAGDAVAMEAVEP